VSAFLLFSPERILEKLSLNALIQNYRPWIAIVLVATSTLILVTIADGIIKLLKRWWRRRCFHIGIQEKLDNLTEQEKQILRPYIYDQTKTQKFGLDNGVVQGLVSAGVLYRSVKAGNPLSWPHNINEHAWNYLLVFQLLTRICGLIVA